ncbi:N-6 DNA methylase [Mannheimia pernigra]|uniref:site-specific DNA-methyltransferase (adenine-specific) n=1 Tax=Mannheimia pernigra TaxID=111844 RepID=A0A7D5HVT4_9PAST|nr:N-6 DNA methylase [Mannheimia pernigra]QLB41131.1 N-6 DNA methylase [Mannheimia pernigra]
MSEELYQYNSLENMIQIGSGYQYLILSNTTFNTLINRNIIKDNIDKKYRKLKPDGLILSGNKEPYKIEAIIENKSPSTYKRSKTRSDVMFQAVEKCQATKCNLGIITNGLCFEPFLVGSNEEEYDYLYTIDDKIIKCNVIKDDKKEKIILNDIKKDKESQLILSEIINSITIDSSIVKFQKEKKNPAELARKVWQSVWLATGDSPKKCLMTFTEIFMYKYLSDLGIISKNSKDINVSFDSTFKKGKGKCLKFYLEDVRPYIKEVFPKGLDDTTIINGLSLKEDKNQDELFYEILNNFKDFGNLKNVSVEFKSNLFEEFLKGSNGIKLMAQFFTPRNIIRSIIDMAEIDKMSEGQKICDPSCGVGGFIQEAIIKRDVDNEFYRTDDDFNSHLIYSGYDLDKDTIILAKASMTVLLSSYINKYRNDVNIISSYINNIFNSVHNSPIGSLSITENKYDLILSNPPYVRKGLSLYNKFIKNNSELEKFYDVSSYSKEGLFVINIIKLLKSGGRAFIILPDGFFHTKSDRGIRNFLLNECILNAIISLPEKTFYTTNKKTYILSVTKKKKGVTQDKKVFNYIVNDVGETLDSARSKTSMNDLNTLIKEYKDYVHNEEYNNFHNNSIFLKDIDYYRQNDMWLSENLLEHEKEPHLAIRDFSEIVDIVNEIGDGIKETLISINDIADKKFNYNYIEIDLSNENQFKFHTSVLGLKQKEYREISAKHKEYREISAKDNDKDTYPVYTAAAKPVAFFNRNYKGLITPTPNTAHISIATDGDGTAGTNIMLHKTPYFINSSRLSIEVLDQNIIPEYIFYAIKSIKKKFGFGYSVKCNKDNLKKYCKVKIPIDDNGNISKEKQNLIIKDMMEKEALLNNLIENLSHLDNVKEFNKFLSI